MIKILNKRIEELLELTGSYHKTELLSSKSKFNKIDNNIKIKNELHKSEHSARHKSLTCLKTTIQDTEEKEYIPNNFLFSTFTNLKVIYFFHFLNKFISM